MAPPVPARLAAALDLQDGAPEEHAVRAVAELYRQLDRASEEIAALRTEVAGLRAAVERMRQTMLAAQLIHSDLLVKYERVLQELQRLRARVAAA